MVANALSSPSAPRRRATRAQAQAEAAGRQHLDVIAASVPEVVRAAGGWLADQALSGWDVNVYVPDSDDVTPLRILGVTAHPIAAAPPAPRKPQTPSVLAISADATGTGLRVGERVAAEHHCEIAELAVWGGAASVGLADRLHSVQYTLSIAARAFKSHALRAAGVAEECGEPTEVFHARARA